MSLAETLKGSPNIKEVYYAKDGSHSFNRYEGPDGKFYTRGGGDFKVKVFDPQHEIVKTVSRDEMLGIKKSEPKPEVKPENVQPESNTISKKAGNGKK